MIDIESERVIPIAEATEYFPGARGKRSHPSKAIRAAKRGTLVPSGDRVPLEHFRAGGRLYTSVEAVQRYVERLTAAWSGASAPSVRSPAQARREYAQAERELDAAWS